MALIKCCECSTEVSEFADKCPKCGCPVSIIKEKNAEMAKDAEFKKSEGERLAAEKAAEKTLKREERRQKVNANRKKIIIISSISAVIICVVAAFAIIYGYIIPQKVAFNNYSSAITEYNQRVAEYNELIALLSSTADERNQLLATANDLLNGDSTPFDENTRAELDIATDDLEAVQFVTPNSWDLLETVVLSSEDEKLSPKKLETKTIELSNSSDQISDEITSLIPTTETINTKQYDSLVETLSTKITAYEDSVKIETQLTNPSEEFVMNRLAQAKSVIDMQAVTEDHDPNGNLHKPGGYTSAIYFTHSYLPSSATGGEIIDNATDGGGCIEVYATKEYAIQRDTYLGAFDGTIFSSGSHTVIGSIVVRTSSNLTASNQDALTKEIIEAFTTL